MGAKKWLKKLKESLFERSERDKKKEQVEVE